MEEKLLDIIKATPEENQDAKKFYQITDEGTLSSHLSLSVESVNAPISGTDKKLNGAFLAVHNKYNQTTYNVFLNKVEVEALINALNDINNSLEYCNNRKNLEEALND